ncbi:cytochrome P450 [Polychytrium aggregatum]|uniref:cytochrome P450 n=1 Tax=Polychytrium aggregatum TaxID=110093 RepID=UPI0022FE9EC8|nr:cytochrome P450 [Polychytrium aggregatum]KAI9201897.1 cytochrome P450 [Polychytrium aggregatum]
MTLNIAEIPAAYLLAGVAALASTAIIVRSIRSSSQPKLPGPKGLPFVGALLDFQPYRDNYQTNVYFCKVVEEYGPICEIPLFGAQLIFTCDAATTKLILNTPAQFGRDDTLVPSFAGFSKNSLFLLPTYNGDAVWKRHRKFLQPAFSPTHLKHAFEVSLVAAQHVDAVIRSYTAKAEPVNVFNLFQKFTIDVIGQVAFSQSFNSVLAEIDEGAKNPKLDHVIHLIHDMLDIIRKRINNPVGFLWGIYGYGHADSQKIGAPIRDFVNDLIALKVETLKSSSPKDEKDMDVLDRLLVDQGTEDERFNNEEIIDEVFGFFMAGHETTANAITWTLFCLSERPDICDKIRTELDQVLGSDRPFAWEDLPLLKYLEACIKEALRLHPVAALLARMSMQDVTVLGYRFPKHKLFFVEIEALHRSERYWKNPKEYRPERFLEDEIIPGSYLPFGDGQHNCIGQKLAMIEIKVAVATILRSFSFTRTPNQQIVPASILTLGLKHGLLLDFKQH